MEQSEAVPNINSEINVVPKTLKTLGILSLIMGGLMILMTLWGVKKTFLPTEQDIAQQQQMLEMIQTTNPDGYDAYVTAMESQGTQNVISLLTQIVSVVGVILMLKLKKTGFYIYVFGELIGYVITISLYGFEMIAGMAGALGETMHTVIWVAVGLGVVFDILFIILYSKQLKYMS